MDIRSVLRLVGSLRFAAVILVLLCIGMACATVYEATHGTPAALLVFYRAWWFELLLWLLGINVLGSMLARYPWSRRHVGFLMTHTSILAILAGAWVTKTWGIDGHVSIVEGHVARRFTIDQEVLALQKLGSEATHSLDLGGGVGDIQVIDRVPGPRLAADDVRVEVQRYVPDSNSAERVLNDNPQPSCALEISLAGSGQTSTAWVFAGERPKHAELPVSLRSLPEAADVDRFLAAPPASQPAAPRIVKVEVKGSVVEMPLEKCLAGPVAVGDTGYSVRVLRYLPHAIVGDNKQLVNASQRPVNPAIEAEITGPAGTSRRIAFARFPDFGSMHGKQDAAGDAKITFIAPADEQEKPPIDIVAGPGGRLAARFDPGDDDAVSRELKVDLPVDTPWPGLRFSVLQRYDNARRERIVEPVDPPREDRTPAILITAERGGQGRQLWLRKHEPQTVLLNGDRYRLAYEDKTVPLSFDVKLNKFRVETYPGSAQPRSFKSHVTFIDSSEAEQSCVISMNHPAKHGGYSLFQSSYEPGRSGPATSVLSVSWDPGLPLVFTGYVTLIAGMLYVLIARMRKRTGGPTVGPALKAMPVPRWSSSPSCMLLVGVLGILAVHVSSAFAEPPARLPTSLDLSAVRAIPVQHDGRWMPLDTVARDVVESITGETFYRGQDPLLWLLAWTFDPPAWLDEPLITIRSAELRGELKLPAEREVFSYAELLRHQPLRKLIEDLSQRSGRQKMNPLESKVGEINRRLLQLQDVFHHKVIRPVPDAKDPMGPWQPISVPEGPDAEPLNPVQSAWKDVRGAFLANDGEGFTKAARQLSAALAELPAAHRPGPRAMATELRYNRLHPYSLAWKIMALGAVLAAAAMGVNRRWFDVVGVVAMLGGFGVLTYGLALRWQIAGRIPAANMFESLLFLSWGAGAFAIVAMLVMRDRSVPLTASAIGALALFLADTLPLDRFIRPVAPVLLDTVWMSIHVPGIMISYAVLALAALIAHVQIIVMALAPGRRQIIDRIDALHYWYMHVGTILLGAGIITGSMWAASSWGRYWGWDPKEVWSLIAFLAYLVIMHVRTDGERVPAWVYAGAAVLAGMLLAIVAPKLAPLSGLRIPALAASTVVGVIFVLVRGQFATAFKSAVAFWFIIMTYIGVNYVLGIGLHSYGFGTGAVVHYMFLAGTIDLLLVAVWAAIYLARVGLRPAVTSAPPQGHPPAGCVAS